MKRREDESFEDYKQRRKEDQEETREKLKGKLIWNSKEQGTYKEAV